VLEQKTSLFVLSNETPASTDPDVQPYRCVYCGQLAKIERDQSSVATAVYCDCEDATTESTYKADIASLQQQLSDKQNALSTHISTKSYDSDTTEMRYEDELTTLKHKYGITV
jgi:hypothetical protein